MTKNTINYSEGNCFLIPLRTGGFARGVAARVNGKGIVFGYFFGPKLEKKQDGTVDSTLRPKNAIFLGKFGDVGLLKGEWPIVGKIEPWSRAGWPMPSLFRIDALGQAGFISYYDEDSLKCVKEVRVELDKIDSDSLAKDGLWGYGAVETRLTNLLD